jgi:hypothetical protein
MCNSKEFSFVHFAHTEVIMSQNDSLKNNDAAPITVVVLPSQKPNGDCTASTSLSKHSKLHPNVSGKCIAPNLFTRYKNIVTGKENYLMDVAFKNPIYYGQFKKQVNGYRVHGCTRNNDAKYTPNLFARYTFSEKKDQLTVRIDDANFLPAWFQFTIDFKQAAKHFQATKEQSTIEIRVQGGCNDRNINYPMHCIAYLRVTGDFHIIDVNNSWCFVVGHIPEIIWQEFLATN